MNSNIAVEIDPILTDGNGADPLLGMAFSLMVATHKNHKVHFG